MIATAPDSRTKVLQVANILGFLLMVGMNFLANFLPLNGKSTGELSDKYPNLFVPSGATFSIWGVIYLLLLVFTIYQASTLFSNKPARVNTVVNTIGAWYMVSSLFNGFWIVVWHYERVPLSVGIMLSLLVSLLVINFRIASLAGNMTGKEAFVNKSPFGVYLGWICVATIANVTTLLISIDWSTGLNEDTWAVIMIIIGAIIVLFAASRIRNGYIALAVVWAFIGIVSKRTSTEPIYRAVALIAGICAFVLFMVGLWLVFKDIRKPKKDTLRPTPIYE